MNFTDFSELKAIAKVAHSKCCTHCSPGALVSGSMGFVQASTDFTTTMCTGAVEYAKELGLTVATGRRSIQRDASTWSHDTDEDADLVYTVAKVMRMCMYMYITWEQRRGGAWRL